MLKGLEVSEVKLADIIRSTETLRFDSDYYAKSYLSTTKLIDSRIREFTKFDALGLIVDGSAFYPALEPYYNTGSYPFLRVGDIKQSIDFENCIKIPKSILPNFPTLKSVRKGDIILTKGGTIANVGLVTKDACVSRDLIFINSSILPEHEYISLYLFFRSDFAYKQLVRSSSKSVQPHLTITLVRDLNIFKLSDTFKLRVTELYKRAIQIKERSKNLYQEAENFLLKSLRLDASKLIELPKTIGAVNVNIKSFSNSFLSAGRLDSEYYQTKYDAVYDLINNSNPIRLVK